jgi:hypothetical protein
MSQGSNPNSLEALQLRLMETIQEREVIKDRLEAWCKKANLGPYSLETVHATLYSLNSLEAAHARRDATRLEVLGYHTEYLNQCIESHPDWKAW